MVGMASGHYRHWCNCMRGPKRFQVPNAGGLKWQRIVNNCQFGSNFESCRHNTVFSVLVSTQPHRPVGYKADGVSRVPTLWRTWAPVKCVHQGIATPQWQHRPATDMIWLLTCVIQYRLYQVSSINTLWGAQSVNKTEDNMRRYAQTGHKIKGVICLCNRTTITRKGGNYSNVLPLKAARRDSIWGFKAELQMSQCRFI